MIKIHFNNHDSRVAITMPLLIEGQSVKDINNYWSLESNEIFDISRISRYGDKALFNDIFENVSILLDGDQIALNEGVVVCDDVQHIRHSIACDITAPIMIVKEILKIVHNQNNSNSVDSEDDSKSEINDPVPVPFIGESQKMIKSICDYLDTHYNGEMNKTMGNLEQLIDNVVLKKNL